MVMDRIVDPISSLSGFDMLGDVRAHKVLGDVDHSALGGVYHNALGPSMDSAMDSAMDYADMHRVDMYRNLPTPDPDTVLAFEAALESGPYTALANNVAHADHVSAVQKMDFANALAMADGSSVPIPSAQQTVIPDTIALPKPETLLAEGVRQLQTAPVVTPPIESAPVEPSWMEPITEEEMDAFQRGLQGLEKILQSVAPTLPDTINQKDLLQLQHAMGEINAYKDIGIQVLKKSAANVDTVLKQQG